MQQFDDRTEFRNLKKAKRRWRLAAEKENAVDLSDWIRTSLDKAASDAFSK